MTSSLPNIINSKPNEETNKRVSFVKVSPRRLSDAEDNTTNKLVKEVINESLQTVHHPIIKQLYNVHEYKPSAVNHPLPKLNLTQPITSHESDIQTKLANKVIHSQQSNNHLVMPQLVMSRTKFINATIALVQQLHISIENIIPPFIEAKNKYAYELMKQGYPESFIEREIEHSILIIMRKLHFNSIHSSINI